MLRSTLNFIKDLCHCKLLTLANAMKAALMSGLVLLASENPWLMGLIDKEAGLKNDTVAMLAENYGWQLEGQWTEAEEEVLLGAAEGIERYVERVADVEGRLWMHTYVGELTFHHGAWLAEALKANVSLPGGHILVLGGFGGSVEPYTDMAHEVAHVIDNKQGGNLPATLVGGGPADEMVAAVGGEPELCRPRILCPEEYGPRVGGVESWPQEAYATTGVAEDFAETFAYAAFFPERVPTGRLAWMDGYVAEMGAKIVAD